MGTEAGRWGTGQGVLIKCVVNSLPASMPLEARFDDRIYIAWREQDNHTCPLCRTVG